MWIVGRSGTINKGLQRIINKGLKIIINK